MHLLRTLLAVFAILVFIAGCNEQDMIDKLTPAGEAAIAKDIVYALIVCVRTPIAKRKWLWMIFIVVGLANLSFNWTNGNYTIAPFYFSILGSGFFSASLYAPTIITLAFPLGAVVFLLRRCSLATGGGQVVRPAPESWQP